MKKQIFKSALIILFCILVVKVDAVLISADADGFTEGADISNAFDGMTLSSAGRTAELDGRVYAVTSELATTGTMVFGHNLENSPAWYSDYYSPSEFNPDDYYLRIDFNDPANMVSIDMVALNDYCYMNIKAYTSNDTMIGWSGSDNSNSFGDILNVQFTSDTYDIAYVVIGGVFGNEKSEAILDNFSANVIPEPATVLLFGLGGLFLVKRRKA